MSIDVFKIIMFTFAYVEFFFEKVMSTQMFVSSIQLENWMAHVTHAAGVISLLSCSGIPIETNTTKNHIYR